MSINLRLIREAAAAQIAAGIGRVPPATRMTI